MENSVMSVQYSFRGSIRGGSRPDPVMTHAEQLLTDMLHAEGIVPRAVYRSGEVCRLLRISRSTLLTLCQLAEHPEVKRTDPRALASFLVGSHHRISHVALVDWLARNQRFQREIA